MFLDERAIVVQISPVDHLHAGLRRRINVHPAVTECSRAKIFERFVLNPRLKLRARMRAARHNNVSAPEKLNLIFPQ
jgi:hypothetical protein